MMTADLGQCEWFVWDLRRSNLIERGRLDQLIADFMTAAPQAEPAHLAQFLVEQGILTQFQADSLLSGKNQGLVLGPYVVIDTLGVGSMGTVYRASSKANNQTYAVKVLPRRSMWNIRMARRKVRDFEQLKHPAIVPFVDVGTAGSMHYLAWPYVEGVALQRLIEEQGKLPHQEAAAYAMRIAEGLAATHAVGIIHGLLKPSNILITAEHEVRILDYGVGALLAETENESVVDTMSTANTMASGLDCASPEGIMDPTQMTIASDQYSLGCTLYYCLTGQVPFPGANAVEKMMAHQTKQPPSIKDVAADVPDGLVEVVNRLMQKVPSDRFESIADAVAALRPFAAGFLGITPNPRLARLAAPPPPARSKPQMAVETLNLRGQPTPTTPLPPSRPPAPPLRGASADRRLGEVQSLRESMQTGGTQRPPSNPALPMRTVARPRPMPEAEPGQGASNSGLTLVLVMAAAMVAACVAGWFLAGTF